MPRIKITVAYIGTQYFGWQIQQASLHRPQPTIQEELERIASLVCEEPIRIHGSGRTDSGVHADAQVAHFDIPESKADIDWQRAFNAQLPHDIAVTHAQKVPESFHARFSATGKRYQYRFWLSRRYTPPRLYPFVWACGPLDVAAMDMAAQRMIGTHDFACFQNQGTEVQSTVRTINAISCTHSFHDSGLQSHNEPALCATDSAISSLHLPRTDIPVELVFSFEADGFLKQMVRNIAGTLVACGKGKLDPEKVSALLASCDRSLLPATAPAKGLTLAQVYYPE